MAPWPRRTVGGVGGRGVMFSMDTRLPFHIQPQPDHTTCGPTCLHAVYQYYGDPVPLERVIAEVHRFEDGGTLAVWLACHALRRGYRAQIFTYNLHCFDPTWFNPTAPDLADRLIRQAQFKTDPKLVAQCHAYLEYLELGGELAFEDLTPRLIRRFLKRGHPILTGLSATYLYRCPREFGPNLDYDDLRGVATGHFVVLCGYDQTTREVLVADPNRENPLSAERIYPIRIERVIGAILLGVLTYDANLLIVEPRKGAKGSTYVDPHRG